MQHARGSLAWYDADKSQARDVVRKAGIASELFTIAYHCLIVDPMWMYGASVFLFDTLTGKAARVTVQGMDEFDIKISSRTADEFFDELSTVGVRDYGYDLEHVVIMR